MEYAIYSNPETTTTTTKSITDHNDQNDIPPTIFCCATSWIEKVQTFADQNVVDIHGQVPGQMDVDDTKRYLEAFEELANREDVRWSLMSNVFFLGGGAFYILSALWDWLLIVPQDGYRKHIYNIVWAIGPFIYLLNGMVDLVWSIKVRQREQRRKYLIKLMMNEAQKNPETQSSSAVSKKRKRIRVKKILKRMKRHVGHRRQVSAALSFVIAAIFSFAAVLADWTGNASASEISDHISVHVYLLSAIFALCGRKKLELQRNVIGRWWPCPMLCASSELLETLGDAFFGIGSMFDVILADMTFDDNVMWWPVLSSCLWLGDALLYLRGDFVTLYAHNSAPSDVLIDSNQTYSCDDEESADGSSFHSRELS
jgi:hypothetical protein